MVSTAPSTKVANRFNDRTVNSNRAYDLVSVGQRTKTFSINLANKSVFGDGKISSTKKTPTNRNRIDFFPLIKLFISCSW